MDGDQTCETVSISRRGCSDLRAELVRGLAQAFTHNTGCPALLAFLAERAGLLADIAAADHRTHAKLLTTTRCARFNLDRTFFPAPCQKAARSGAPQT
jgi:hypothetical protein